MSPFIIIAYYTLGNQYEQLSENLTKSCNELNLPLFLKPIEDLGSWEKNTHYKASFIQVCLGKFQKNLVYVDVDAVFRSYPKIFEDLNYDIAYRTENFRWRSNEALSGTLFLRNNDRVKSFVQTWIDLNNENPADKLRPDTWEQANMQRAMTKSKGIKYYNLPPQYTYIFDHTKALYPGITPVIEHFQASRKADI
jgi:hypothetical protein